MGVAEKCLYVSDIHISPEQMRGYGVTQCMRGQAFFQPGSFVELVDEGLDIIVI